MNESKPNTKPWKIIGALAVLAVVLLVFVVAPSLGGTPDPGPDIQTPSMKNVPPSGALTLEVDRDLASTDTADSKGE